MCNTINMLYIDDDFDLSLSRFLHEYKVEGIEINYSEIKFENSSKYEELLNDSKVKNANIIIIDSRLFKNDSATGKFSGEEFRMILKKEYSYIEVLVISQNEDADNYGYIRKFDKESGKGNQKYYHDVLDEKLRLAINNVIQYRNIMEKLSRNDQIGKIEIEKINNTLEGLKKYDELKTDDINGIIKAFQALEKRVFHE